MRSRTLGIVSLVVVAAAIVVGAAAAAYGRPAPVTPIAPAPTAAASVEILTDKELGSGVHIGNGNVLTAAHVVRNAKDVRVKAQDGKTYGASVLWRNDKYDIALLSAPNSTMPAAVLACGKLEDGADIFSVGNPLGVDFVSAYGHIAGKPRKVGDTESLYVINMAVIFGQSGGPIFHDNKVYGIMSAVMVAPLTVAGATTPTVVGFGYAVPSTVVCDLLARASA